MTFEPLLDILPAPQRQLWPELATVAHHHVLYGGTALALRLGHRESIDFDFFSHDDLDANELDALPWMRGSTTLQQSANTRTVLVERGGSIKVSFFGAIRFGRVGDPETTADGTLRVASMEDLGGTKIKALVQRIEAKDYRDVDALIRSGIPLSRILGAASKAATSGHWTPRFASVSRPKQLARLLTIRSHFARHVLIDRVELTS